MSKSKSVMKTAVFAIIAMLAVPAMASTANTDFDAVFTTLKDWVEGSLGRVLAIAMIVIGITMGVARQSILAFAIGIAAGLGLYTAPTIIESIVSVTI